MFQLKDELSEIDLPCKVDNSLVDEFYEDINHGSQHQDVDSSTGPIRSNTVRTGGTVTVQKSEAKPLKKTIWKKSLIMIMTSTSRLKRINQSVNQSINQLINQEKITGTQEQHQVHRARL